MPSKDKSSIKSTGDYFAQKTARDLDPLKVAISPEMLHEDAVQAARYARKDTDRCRAMSLEIERFLQTRRK